MRLDPTECAHGAPLFEQLETRLLLDGGPPIAIGDAYAVSEDGTLSLVSVSITIDPDTYPDGSPVADEDIITNAYPGLTLTAEETGVGTPVLKNSDVLAQADGLASTGANVFGHTSKRYYEEDKHEWGDGYQNWLRIDFANGATSVSLDFIADSGSFPGDDSPVLRAFNSADVEVDMATVAGGYMDGYVVTLTVSAADIAYVKAQPDLAGNSAWLLDHLVYETAAGVLVNDSDPEGDALTAELVAGPLHGELSFNANGTFEYAPDANFNGVDTFTYKASDGTAYSNVATVTITVNPVNDAPVAAGSSPVTGEDIPVQIDLRTLVEDVETADDALIFTVGGAVNGTVSLLADGYTARFEPAANYNGPASFTYGVTDTGDNGTAPIAVGPVAIDVTVNNLVDLSGRVFDDRNNDGLFDDDDGDAGIGEVNVEVWDQSMTTMYASATTLADGSYFLNANLDAGTYKIIETQAAGYLDGQETAGSLGGTVDNTQDWQEIGDILVGAAGTTPDAGGYDFAELQPASLQGVVWEDLNDDGEVDLGELAIENVAITLTGVDDRGEAIQAVEQLTNAQGIFEFIDLRPGEYAVAETQPTGFLDGQDALGEVVELAPQVVLGYDGNVDPAGDAFAGIDLVAGASGVNYNFGERIDGGEVHTGQTAKISFWQNGKGRALIRSLNGSPDSTILADWLAETFPNMYGSLAGMTNVQVADFYKQAFKRHDKFGPGKPQRFDAQVLAVALATFVTKESLAGLVYDPSTAEGGQTDETFLFTDVDADGVYEPGDGDAATIDALLIADVESYGFSVTASGLGSTFVNIGDSGAAFEDYVDGEDVQVIDLLLATDSMTTNGLLYDVDGSADIDDVEAVLRAQANDVYVAISELGEI